MERICQILACGGVLSILIELPASDRWVFSPRLLVCQTLGHTQLPDSELGWVGWEGEKKGAQGAGKKCLERCLTPCQEKEGNKSEKGLEREGWEKREGGEARVGAGEREWNEWKWGLKKEKRASGVQKGAFESTLIKACVMDRTCGRAFFSFLSVCVCVWGDGVTMGGAGALVEMSTASSLNGTKTWIETSKQPLWARPPPPFFAVPWLCDGQQAPVQVCPCVCVWFCLAVCYFLTATCISWQLCVQCGFQSVSFCLGVLFVLCDDVCVCVLKSRLQDADIIGAEDLTHCSLPLNWAPALYGGVGSETSSPQSWRVEEIIVAKWYTGI